MKIGNGNPFVLATTAAFALGSGVFGTMLWNENRASKPVAAPAVARVSAPPASAPANVANVANSGLPAQPSTLGMTPAQAALTLGNWYYDTQQWPMAMEKYRFALTNGLDTPDVRTDYGNSLRFAGQPQKALEQYKIAQKQDPSHEQSLFNQGGLWAFSLGDNAKAVAAWQVYLKRFPNGQSAPDARDFIQKHQKK